MGPKALQAGQNGALPAETEALIQEFSDVKAAADAQVVFSLHFSVCISLCCCLQRAPKSVASSKRLTQHMNELLAETVRLLTPSQRTVCMLCIHRRLKTKFVLPEDAQCHLFARESKSVRERSLLVDVSALDPEKE